MLKKVTFVMVIMTFLICNGCHFNDTKLSSCDARILTHADFLHHPAFSSLTYHRRTEGGNRSYYFTGGYDVWADSKFDFKSAVQFSFIPTDTSRENAFCVNATSLRLVLPMDVKQKELLTAFNNEVAKRMDIHSNEIQKRIENMLVNGELFKVIAEKNHILIKAGSAHHQFRGNLFVVAIESDQK